MHRISGVDFMICERKVNLNKNNTYGSTYVREKINNGTAKMAARSTVVVVTAGARSEPVYALVL